MQYTSMCAHVHTCSLSTELHGDSPREPSVPHREPPETAQPAGGVCVSVQSLKRTLGGGWVWEPGPGGEDTGQLGTQEREPQSER